MEIEDRGTMSIEVAASDASTPCTEMSIFDEEWKDYGGGGPFDDLEAVAGFNASFENNNRNDMDPQLLSTPSTSAGTLNLLLEDMRNQQTQEDRALTTKPATIAAFVDGAYSTPQTANQAGSNDRVATPSAFDPEGALLDRPGTLVNFHPLHLFHDQTMTPCYYPSIELHSDSRPSHQMPTYPAFPHHHELHRRSVSEPPTGPTPRSFQHNHHHPSAGIQPPMTFRRADRIVGTQTLPQGLTRLKPLPRDRRQNRHQAYSINKRDMQKGRNQRDELRRAKTQSVRAPTSMPSSPMDPQQIIYMDDSPAILPHQVSSSQISPLQLVSTRICTPTPSPERVLSPPPIIGEAMDGTDGTARLKDEQVASLSIPISVEQLQALITEAVQKAVRSVEKDNEISKIEKTAEDDGSRA